MSKHSRRLSAVLISALSICAYSAAMADPVSFTDTFDRPYLQFGGAEDTGRPGSDSDVTQVGDRLKLVIVPPLGEYGYTSQYFLENYANFSMTGSISSESVVAQGGYVEYSITGRVFNSIQAGGVEANTREGDVRAQIALSMNDQRQVVANYCIWGRNADDSYDNRFLGGRSCALLSDAVNLDEQYTLSMSVDDAAGAITFSIDDTAITYTFAEPVFAPREPFREVLVDARGDASVGVGYSEQISSDDFTENFDTPLLLGRYFASRVGEFSVANDELRLSVASDAEGRQDARLTVRGEADKIQSTLRLSSESSSNSTPDFRSRARFMVSGTMYNELAAGGTDGELGNVFAQVFVALNPDGSITRLACASRGDDAEFSTFTNLDVAPDTDEICGRFSTEVALDESITASVGINREAKQLIFTLGSEEIIYAIQTDVFEPSVHYKAVRARAEGESNAVVYVEEVVVSASATASTPVIENPGTEISLSDGDITSFSGTVYSSSAVELFWQASTGGSFELLRNGESVYVGDGRSFYDDGLMAASLNDYTLKTNAAEESLALVTLPSFTIPEAQPAAPSNLRAEAYSSSAVEIFWDRVTSTPTARGYEVSRDGAVLTALDGLSYFEEGLQANTAYSYSVVSISSEGQRSDPSVVVISTRE